MQLHTQLQYIFDALKVEHCTLRQISKSINQFIGFVYTTELFQIIIIINYIIILRQMTSFACFCTDALGLPRTTHCPSPHHSQSVQIELEEMDVSVIPNWHQGLWLISCWNCISGWRPSGSVRVYGRQCHTASHVFSLLLFSLHKALLEQWSFLSF